MINRVVSQFHLRQLILFLLAPHFGNLNFGMITENIERCHTYHEVSRHLKGYLLLRVKMHVLYARSVHRYF